MIDLFKHILSVLFLFLLFIGDSTIGYAQHITSPPPTKVSLEDWFEDDPNNKDNDGIDWVQSRTAFHFLRGPGAEEFAPTLEGLGSISGLLIVDHIFLTAILPLRNFKRLNLRVWQGTPIVIMKPIFGFVAKKFRFSRQLYIPDEFPEVEEVPQELWGQKVGGSNPTYFTADTREGVVYNTGFFRYSKSKLVISTIRFAPEVGVLFGAGKNTVPVYFTVGPVLDFTIGAKKKNKFKRDGVRQKELKTGVSELNVNNLQYGVSATLLIAEVELYGNFILNPLFTDLINPDVYATEVGVKFDLDIFDTRKE